MEKKDYETILASELIILLQKMVDEFGDFPVFSGGEGWGEEWSIHGVEKRENTDRYIV